MSTLFSVTPNDEVGGTAVQTNAICLSVARKHLPFDERERIKKRRKQLNPVRLSVEYVRSEDSTNDKDDTSDTDSSEKHITYPYTREPSTSFTTIVPSPLESIPVPLNLTKNSRVENFPAEIKKAESFNSRPEEKVNIFSPRKDEIRNELPKYPKPQTEPSESPNYEQFMANAFAEEKPSTKDQSPPFSPRTPPVSVMRSLFTNAVTRTSCRIFNPEAFCNICNKEFCNKYFLKTHKANKHGVYCETKDNTDTEVLPTNAVPLMFTWNVKNNNVKLPSNPYLLNANAVKDSSAFCNVCEKEFCNKYFLRRHKEKMHGIVSYDGRKSDASCDSDNKGNETDDTDRANQTEDAKFSNFYQEKKNELNQNLKSDLLVKANKDGKLKYPKYSTNATDAVSDFIKICLTNSVAKNSTQKTILDERFPVKDENIDVREFSKLNDQDSVINLIKKEDHFTDYSHQHISAEYDANTRKTPSRVSTGEFGVQAKEEDFHEMDDQNAQTTQNGEVVEQKFACELCNKMQSTYSIMKLHQKYVHAMNVDDSVKTEGCDEEAEFKHIENVYFMILKFSWLNTVVTFCEICKTEFEKNEVLEMHLMNKHGSLVDEISRIIEDAGANGMLVPATNVGDGNLLCQFCNKTFSTNIAFQQHVYEKCGVPDFKDYSDYFPGHAIDEASDSSKTRNFCEICKKELCNKYFMKTHMRRMHGISIQNGVRIGGVTCEICNKELCSKYFLRVHKKNCHGIMENMQFARLMVTQNDDKEEYQKHASQVCAICGRIFKSMKWLKTHLFNDHGKLGASVWHDILASFNNDHDASTGTDDTEYTVTSPPYMETEEKPQLYQCSRCQFQASSVDLLLTHQRLHSKTGEFQYRCMYCFVITKDKVSLEEHIAYHHFTGNNGEFHDNAKDFGARFAAKMDLDAPYDLVTNGNCARVIDYDRSN